MRTACDAGGVHAPQDVAPAAVAQNAGFPEPLDLRRNVVDSHARTTMSSSARPSRRAFACPAPPLPRRSAVELRDIDRQIATTWARRQSIGDEATTERINELLDMRLTRQAPPPYAGE